jgi:hypothetical protein
MPGYLVGCAWTYDLTVYSKCMRVCVQILSLQIDSLLTMYNTTFRQAEPTLEDDYWDPQ